MKSVTVTDGSVRYTILLREDEGSLPEMSLPEKITHLAFIEWWQAYCSRVHVPAPLRGPEAISIVKRLLESHGLEELQQLAVHFFLDHGDRLRENPHHFAIFASMLSGLKEELKAREQT